MACSVERFCSPIGSSNTAAAMSIAQRSCTFISISCARIIQNFTCSTNKSSARGWFHGTSCEASIMERLIRHAHTVAVWGYNAALDSKSTSGIHTHSREHAQHVRWTRSVLRMTVNLLVRMNEPLRDHWNKAIEARVAPIKHEIDRNSTGPSEIVGVECCWF